VDSEGLRTRLATHADVPAVVETLGLAFYDDPTWSQGEADATAESSSQGGGARMFRL
jgi:hypothetical protein